jgi:hypothetical protein
MPLTKYKSNFDNDPFRWDEESSVTEVPTEMIQTSLALGQPTALPSSPNLLPSKYFVTLSNTQELVKAATDIQMASTHAPRYTCSHMPPEDLSEATLTDLYSPTPCHGSPTNKLSLQIVTTKYIQQFLDILQSLSTKQGPPPPLPKPSGESGEPKARASRLEFKTVNKVYVFNTIQVQTY